LQRSKINDYFSFPEQVDMRPYTIEHLSDPESDVEEDIFELVGVLVHSGTAESGHYYSYIRERPSSANRPAWVEFNDDMVTPWDPAHMEYSTFGGTDPRSLYDNNGMMCDKNYSAYMLFYQRASSLRAEQDKMMDLGGSAPLRVQVPEELDDHIMDENTLTLRRHCIYDQSNIRLAQCLFHQSQQYCETAGEADTHQNYDDFVAKFHLDHGLQDLAMQTLVGNLDQVVTRTKDIPDLQTYSKSILEAVGSCGSCAFSYYSYFSQHPRALRILLQRNPDPGVRNFVGKSFITAVATISRRLPQVYDPQISYSPDSDLGGDEEEYFSGPITSRRSVIDGVMILLDHLWKFFHIHIRAWDEYFGTVLNFARLGYRETEYVLTARFLAKTIQIISADPLQDLDGNWAKMLHNILRRSSTRQTSYASIIALAHHLMDQMDSRVGPNFSEVQPTERVSQMNEAFKWTSGEVGLVYRDLGGSQTSLFVEKLLALDQAQVQSDRIIRLLVRLDKTLDDRVLATLKQCIRGETSTQAMDPFLRAAITYIESTDQLRNAKEIVDHIFMQAKSLQNTEGVYFLKFFKTALNLKQQETEFAGAVRSYALERVPNWVPYLLASQDRVVRASTETFLIRTLFDVVTESTPNDDDSDDDNTWGDRDIIKQTTKHIGVACLKYLREQHVRKRNQVVREVANRFLKVIGQCVDALNSDPSTQTELDLEFLTLQDGKWNPLYYYV
jgi:ubiquitin carboxyl-terminal hydrolase 34